MMSHKRSSVRHNSLLIVGTGALASLFAARLIASGQQVTMFGSWQQAIDTLNTNGLKYKDGNNRTTTFPVNAVSNVDGSNRFLYAIVLVKSWQTQNAASLLKTCLHPEGLALTLQNGLGNYQTLKDYIGENRTAGGATTLGATLIEPGYVRLGGDGEINVGKHDRLDGLIRALRRAGFTVHRHQSVESLIWEKLLINVGINPLTAILKVRNGKLLDLPTVRDLVKEVSMEVCQVANAAGVELDIEYPFEMVEKVALRTAENYSSMLQDIRRGAPTEIDAMCGQVVEIGNKYGIPTPINYSFWKLVKALVDKGQK